MRQLFDECVERAKNGQLHPWQKEDPTSYPLDPLQAYLHPSLVGQGTSPRYAKPQLTRNTRSARNKRILCNMPKLKIKIGADDKEVGQKLAQVKSKFGKFAKDLRGGLNTAFGAGGSALSFVAITRMFSGVIDKMDQIGKSARALGVTAEGYQKIGFAARRANMPQDRLNMSFQRMANFMHGASQGGEKQKQILSRLGLEYGSLLKMKPDEQFIAIGKAIDKVTNATERLALANKIYGRGARDVLNMVRGYEGVASELEGKGGIVSDDDIKAAEDFKDKVETMKTRGFAAAARYGLLQTLDALARPIGKMMDRGTKKGMFDFNRSSKDDGLFTDLVRALTTQYQLDIKDLYGGATTPEAIAAKKKAVEEGRADPGLSPSLGKMLGGRLGRPSADAMHQIGGYLTPGQFDATHTAEGHLASIDEKMTIAVERILTRRREWTPEMEQNFIGNSINGAVSTQ